MHQDIHSELFTGLAVCRAQTLRGEEKNMNMKMRNASGHQGEKKLISSISYYNFNMAPPNSNTALIRGRRLIE